jgi:hemolysin activation/secretion protein
MKKHSGVSFSYALGSAFLCAIAGQGLAAEVLPGPADIDRVRPEQRELPPPSETGPSPNLVPSQPMSTPPIPKEAKRIRFVLRDIRLEGVTTFSDAEMRALYQPLIGKEITLETAYVMAGTITDHYQKAGYFLSHAFVPAQEIGNGVVTIKVVEGYVGEVALGNADAKGRVVHSIIDEITAQKPANIHTLERELLLLNDLPGLAFQATFEPMPKDAVNMAEGAVRLVLTPEAKPAHSSVGTDNLGSRYLGPYEALANWDGSIIPLQQTSLSGLTSVPMSNLNSLSATQKWAVMADTSIELTGSYITSHPGYRLEPEDIESHAEDIGVSIDHQIIRQRQENLQVKLGLDGRNSDTDILGTALTRDKIRAVRATVNYDVSDPWAGYDYFGFTLSKGLAGLGSSDGGEPNLSRSGAIPDFTKADLTFTRLQAISNSWLGVFAFSAQRASNTLFSSEEFGYGGQAFGRAYDLSEISGDNGMAGSLELRYQSLPTWHTISWTPYGFYDIGKVWNFNDVGQPGSASGASAGLGMRFLHASDLNGNFYFAQPLTKSIETPLYGESDRSPRIVGQLQYTF